MKDTPKHIRALQLKIWLSKPPMERLRQMIADNDALMKFWEETSKKNKIEKPNTNNSKSSNETNKKELYKEL